MGKIVCVCGQHSYVSCMMNNQHSDTTLLFFIFLKEEQVLIYFWLHLVFVAVRGLSLLAGATLVAVRQLLSHFSASRCKVQALWHVGFS